MHRKGTIATSGYDPLTGNAVNGSSLKIDFKNLKFAICNLKFTILCIRAGFNYIKDYKLREAYKAYEKGQKDMDKFHSCFSSANNVKYKELRKG
ncbi:MAG: hypothetical protein AB1630_10065 [bacterium]